MHNTCNLDLTTDFELAALDCLKNCSFHLFFVAVGKIPFKLACNEDIHNILIEFKFQRDGTTHCGVSCP